MPTGSEAVAPRSTLMALDKGALHRKMALVGCALVALAAVSLCINDATSSFADPGEVLACYALWFQQAWAAVADPVAVMEPNDIIREHAYYFSIVNRAGVTAITIVAGMLLALAGSLYQNVFRNPIAAPTMLGVSSGMSLALVLFVVVFGTAALELSGMRYLFCYVAVVVTLVLLLVFSKLISGKGKAINIVNMLLVGTVMSQLMGVVVTYINWYVLDDDLWAVYNEISEVLTVNTEWYSFVAIGIACIVAIGPIYLLRFRLNVLGFDESDMRMLGVDPTRLQVIALVCGTIMIITAQIQTGTVAMISLVVPHVSRFLFGAEFGKQFFGNLLLGAALLLLCRCVVGFIPFVGGGLPIGTVVSFVVLPAFVWMIATQQRTWE